MLARDSLEVLLQNVLQSRRYLLWETLVCGGGGKGECMRACGQFNKPCNLFDGAILAQAI